MKKILFALLITCGFATKAQMYNNEWIDYSKTYYKFKVIKNGVHRIPQSTLASIGLGATPAQNFQLWRNGVQVPIYTNVASGTFSNSDYIEFWGLMNDGKPDNELYRNPRNQLNNKWSLISDTAVYFLTVNNGSNLRLQTTPNNVAGNTLLKEPYFLHTTGKYFKDRINLGEAYNVVEYLYSSSYDKGEGWSSGDIVSTYSQSSGFVNGTQSLTFNNLFPYSGGPNPKFKIAVSGNTFNTRTYSVTINGDPVLSNMVAYMDHNIDSNTISPSVLSSGNATVVVKGSIDCPNPPNCPGVDRMTVHKYELTYPRQFNFGGASNFEFTLPANVSGNYLEITGFNYGSIAPVLYDLTNNKRYVADISSAPIIKIVLAPSATARDLVLVNEESANVITVSSMVTKNFINYSAPANRGNYLIISNELLFNGATGNPVEAYKTYRSSAPGGSYNAKIYLADELIDQFGFGIRKNPAGIRNFIRFARNTFPETPKSVFLIGKGVDYVSQRTIELQNNPTDLANTERLNLIPTYGWPASDVLLASEQGRSFPLVPIGRLSAVSAAEVDLYLKKIIAYELAQQTPSPVLKDRNWMKNVVHIIGTSEPGLDAILSSYMENYKAVIQDTLFGAKVSTFRKTTTTTGEQLTSSDLTNLFNTGISLITYFGHSSAQTLDFNLDEPLNYSNYGKYPLFLGLGCNVGNFFTANTLRFSQVTTISEKYVLSPDRGTIALVGSTHFGIVHYLDIWNQRAYERISRKDYGKPIGEIMKGTVEDVYNFTTEDDFFARANTEQTELHGDPAIKINTHPKPDYIIEDQNVKVDPSFISIADADFNVQAKFYNNGRAIDKNLTVEVKRQFPDGSTTIVKRETIPGIRYVDSISVDIPIVDQRKDKGLNKIIVTIDADNAVDEMFETNNTITKDVMIYEDEARPVYPSDFAIINKQNIKLIASTADPLSSAKQYRMEFDTTELFNSPFKITRNITQVGGVIEFDPGVTFKDSVVYYWRVAMIPASGPINWNVSSFIYLSNYALGFNQSHVYQHLESKRTKMNLDNGSNWTFGNSFGNLTIKNGVFPTAARGAEDFSIFVNGLDYIRSVCGFPNIIVNVFDPYTFKPWYNGPGGQAGQYGSDVICADNRGWNFQFSIMDSSKRRKLVEFLELIPSGHYVVVRNISGTDPANNYYTSNWKSDTSYLGRNRSIYHHLYNQGFADADSFDRPRAFIFTYKKNDNVGFSPKSIFSQGINDKIALTAEYPTPDTLGFITSPVFGPAKNWLELRWRGVSIDPTMTDAPTLSLIGIQSNGTVDTLKNDINASQQILDISSFNANIYPYMQLHLRNMDSINRTPYQLKYWRLTYVPVPEGALAPNITFKKKDTFDIAEPFNFQVAFKNVSDGNFDSLKIKMVITDRNNVQRVIPPFKVKKLPAMDTVNVSYPLDTRTLLGNNTLYLEVNPDKDQPEQFHFNNVLYTNFYVKGDTLNPLMDVTFDNVHILNHDIVSSKPTIVIKLKDEAKWFLLNDPSVVKVQVRFPDGSLRAYNFNSDTLKFTAASVPNGDNTATVTFTPKFLQDGEYELIVSGKDMSDNAAGAMQYRIFFQVINKAMISNMLNYPNPFTTSTAFVFTVTGSEVPQNLKIQIMTVTGKIVREITKDELGPLHVGRNITQYKWDGTDQYGQKLANGVYLYRVATNLNGRSLEKYKADDDETEKFFTKGYGKMYLMR